jgi:hypothetical protein
MMYKPQNLKRWTLPHNYIGAIWPNYFSAGVGQSRDSSAVERSNFASMLKALGGESETVIVVRESHWAVGWVEWIAIHQNDDRALKIADQMFSQFGLIDRRRKEASAMDQKPPEPWDPEEEGRLEQEAYLKHRQRQRGFPEPEPDVPELGSVQIPVPTYKNT